MNQGELSELELIPLLFKLGLHVSVPWYPHDKAGVHDKYRENWGLMTSPPLTTQTHMIR